MVKREKGAASRYIVRLKRWCKSLGAFTTRPLLVWRPPTTAQSRPAAATRGKKLKTAKIDRPRYLYLVVLALGRLGGSESSFCFRALPTPPWHSFLFFELSLKTVCTDWYCMSSATPTILCAIGAGVRRCMWRWQRRRRRTEHGAVWNVGSCWKHRPVVLCVRAPPGPCAN
jgi:hypothetical protein